MNWIDALKQAPAIVLTIDGIPPSKKNRQRILRNPRTGRPMVKASKAACAFEQHLGLVAQRLTSLGSRYVGVVITIDEERERTRIEVYDCGEQPKRGRRGTKRDVHNCADAVMDALQGRAFDDDRQARFTLTLHGEVA